MGRRFLLLVFVILFVTGISKPQNTLSEKYIVFFLTNTSVDQADSINQGKDANTSYTFVGELPQIFGSVKKDNPYKYAFGLPGPMLLTQSVSQMQYEINKAFDIAEKYDVPVYFQLDDCNNYTTEFGSAASPKYYENPDWCEWVAFPQGSETWGGQSNGRLPYYWFNWGSWMHAQAFPAFQSTGFRSFVLSQLNDGVLEPLMARYKKLVSEGREYLFAGLAVGWETHIPDYSTGNTLLNVSTSNLPVNILLGDTMKVWEASKYGYNSLSKLGYTSYNRQALYQVIHDYSQLLAETIYEAGIPRHKIFTHMVGFMSSNTSLQTTFAPPIWAAVNQYSIPGYTLSPASCPYNLSTLVSNITTADNSQQYFACAEGYSRGVDTTYQQSDNYFNSMFGNGAALVTVFGWGREASTSAFAVSHSLTSPFVLAAKKWLNKWEFTNDVEGWTSGNNISGFGWQTGGYIGGTITGTDAYIKSEDNLNINITNKRCITVRIKNSSPQTIGQIYFLTTTDNTWNEAKHKDFTMTANSDFITYTIDMSTVSGWTGNIRQLRIDPCNAPSGSSASGSFQIDFVHVGNPMWEFANDTESWTSGNNISGFGWQTGGYIGGAITGYDAYILSGDNLGINISNRRFVNLRIKNSSPQTIGQVYFTTTTDNTWNDAKHKDFTMTANDTGFVEYTIDMSTVSGWTGNIKQLRIDPCNAPPGTSVSGSFQIDFIQIANPVWEFANDTESWTSVNNISGFGWQTGGYIGGTITGTDANIKSGDNLDINISNKQYINVRIKNSSPQTIGQIYFLTATDNTWNEAKHKDFTMTANSDFITYTIDMSTVSTWTGDLRQLRIDPCNAIPGTTVSGSFQIDYIHISNASNGLYKTSADLGGTSSGSISCYTLNQNFPNPFNPATQIKYSIPRDGMVTLKLYNILGQEVASLVNQVQKAGTYNINFNASNLPDGRQGLASGVYLYRLQAGSFISTKKMILLK
jgi:hypothetical protein